MYVYVQVKEKYQADLSEARTRIAVLETNLSSAEEEAKRVQEEMRSYKARANALLRKKEEEYLEAIEGSMER